ncbi:response regulator [Segetibacter koreensis]|uniref:response regulator n=1 Tax=Segetibacter koreensis TaxID=398037 RepID=UPI00036DD76D|nr:response regulator [Segetibacter koreensis]
MNIPCKILLVDDDRDDQMIFRHAINEINTQIECNCYDNAEQGLRALKTDNQHKPDFIFLDLNLPFMHGFEFLQLLKTSEDLNDIPVIIYSTSSRDSDKIKARELGALNYLSKPTSFNELKVKITNLLNEVYN